MKKLFVAALAVLALAPVGATRAANGSVQITSLGFVPRHVAIRGGESVTWTNADTVAHRVVFSQRAGLQCAQPLIIQPTQSGSCTFARAGTFSYADPTDARPGFKGSVTVGPPSVAVTIQAAPTVVRYGSQSTLSGAIAPQKSGENVELFAQQCGQSAFSRADTAVTTTAGAYSRVVQPTMATTYQARYKGATSQVGVKVEPRLGLGKVARHKYRVQVLAAQSFAGKVAVFQRFSTVTGLWVRVRFVVLRRLGTGVAPTVISGVTFRSSIKPGRRVRVVLGSTQTAPCYLAGRSNVIRS